MIYMGPGKTQPDVRWMLHNHELGLLCQPWGTTTVEPGWIWAADNGCFADTWTEDKWLEWLSRPHPRAGCLFAAVPDVIGDHAATLERFHHYAPTVRSLRYPVAFVAQDGVTPDEVPWDEMDALFVGGTTEFKMGAAAFEVAQVARERGKWVHVGRVNSYKRLAYWAQVAQSADGTHMIYEPNVAAARVRGWIQSLRAGQQMTLTTDEGNTEDE